MSRTCYVFAPADAAAPWRWCVPGEGGDYATGSGLDALAATDEGGAAVPRDAVLVVPGEEVLATRITVPTRSRRQIEAALPYLVEEFLAEDVDALHLAAGARAEDGSVPVRVLRPERLRGWLEELAAHDLVAVSARVDEDALAAEPASVDVWIGAERALVRAWRSAFAVTCAELTTFLGAFLATRADDTPLTFRVGATADADADLLLAELAPLLGTEAGVSVERRLLGESLEASLAEAMEAAGSARSSAGAGILELLTGAFRPARRRERRSGYWRLAAGLVLGWILLEGGLDLGRSAWLEARTETLREENLTLFRQILPDRTRSPDPRRELESLVGTPTGSSASFLGLVGVVSAELGALGGDTELRSMNWNTQRGDLSVDLSVPGITQVDQFKDRLEAGGFPVTIDSAVQEQAGVRARLRVRDGGAG